MIEIEDETTDGFVRVWALDESWRPTSAADPVAHTHPGAAQALGRNAAIRELVEGVETYRARLATPTPNRNRRLQIIDMALGYVDGGPDPEWIAYDAMREHLAGTPAVIRALDRLERQEPEEGDAEMVEAYVEDGAARVPASALRIRVKNLQLRMALTEFNLRDQVQAAVDVGPWQLKDLWDWSEHIHSDNEFIVAGCDQLGVTPEQRMAIFNRASQIEI